MQQPRVLGLLQGAFRTPLLQAQLSLLSLPWLEQICSHKYYRPSHKLVAFKATWLWVGIFACCFS